MKSKCSPRKKWEILRATDSYGQIVKKNNKLAKIRLKSRHCRWFDMIYDLVARKLKRWNELFIHSIEIRIILNSTC